MQLSPDATLMSPVEFSPQSASSIDLEHSGAASAIETYVGLEAPAISARAARLDNRITGSSICDPLTLALPRLFVEQLIQPSAMPNERSVSSGDGDSGAKEPSPLRFRTFPMGA